MILDNKLLKMEKRKKFNAMDIVGALLLVIISVLTIICLISKNSKNVINYEAVNNTLKFVVFLTMIYAIPYLASVTLRFKQ